MASWLERPVLVRSPCCLAVRRLLDGPADRAHASSTTGVAGDDRLAIDRQAAGQRIARAADCQHAVRGMLTVGGGSIVLTGSPTAVRAGEGADFTAYASSEAGMHGLGRTVAAAYARRGIRVNTVVPPCTETGLVIAITGDPGATAAIVGRIPMGRAGTTRDLEGVMVYLASDESAFATGATFAVDGGMTTL